MKKKLLALTLAATMMVSTAIPAFAAANDVVEEVTAQTEVSTEDEGIVDTNSLFQIDAVDLKDADGYAYTEYKLSYDGMSIKELEALENPIYIAARISSDGENWYGWSDLSYYASYDTSIAALYFDGYVQFAVTDIKMDGMFSYKTELADDANHLALSQSYKITESGNSNYVSAPMLMKSTPAVSATITPGSHKMSITFSEQLEEVSDVSIDILASQNHLDYSVDNIQWSNETETVTVGDVTDVREVSVVTFDFVTDQTYNTHNAKYTFQINGLVGIESQKAPAEFSYKTKLKESGCTGRDDFFMGASTFLVANNIFNTYKGSVTDTRIADTNIFLVAKTPSYTNTYVLNVDCSDVANLVIANKTISLGVPYPAGLDPRYDGNVTYTAYKMVKQANGKYKKVQVTCNNTDKGLFVKSK